MKQARSGAGDWIGGKGDIKGLFMDVQSKNKTHNLCYITNKIITILGPHPKSSLFIFIARAQILTEPLLLQAMLQYEHIKYITRISDYHIDILEYESQC